MAPIAAGLGEDAEVTASAQVGESCLDGAGHGGGIESVALDVLRADDGDAGDEEAEEPVAQQLDRDEELSVRERCEHLVAIDRAVAVAGDDEARSPDGTSVGRGRRVSGCDGTAGT
ncbi:hypothetical protein [Brevibacterium sp. CT2-23B]|uniref:hypothetical protein n=1 Tax=Brevibacterium sp. CT2-23B TaxID=2729630 RepID=UPI0015565570|nr:hypothetical protein [Brevibacterium sp. CT2-23B]